MLLRSVRIPPAFYPLSGSALWLFLYLSYLPILREDLGFAVQILLGELLIANLLLVLVWFLAGRAIFTVLASALALITVYTMLFLGEPGLWIQLASIFLIYLWLNHLTRQIDGEKVVHLVNREKVQAKVNLAMKALGEKEHLGVALGKKHSRLNYLREFSDHLKDLSSLKQAAEIVATEVAEIIPHTDQVLLYILDEKTYELALAAHANRASGLEAKEKKGNEYDTWVLRRSQPLLIEDTKSDFRFSYDPRAEFQFRCIAIVPLVSERKVFGVLHLNALTAGAFHTDDLRFLDIVADLSAVALRNVLLFEKSRELAIIDSLTECYLFRHAQERLAEEVQRALRAKSSFAVVMADIDHFKKYNDEFGHTAGDRVLKLVSEIMRSNVGAADLVCRYGGEEFLLVLPQKDSHGAYEVAEKIRKKTESRPFDLRRASRTITLSLGIAVFPEDGTTKEELIWKADKRLYEAKHAGRNRTAGGKARGRKS